MRILKQVIWPPMKAPSIIPATEILSIAVQYDKVVCWYKESDDPSDRCEVTLVPTGVHTCVDKSWKFHTTVLLNNGSLVLHCFVKILSKPQ